MTIKEILADKANPEIDAQPTILFSQNFRSQTPSFALAEMSHLLHLYSFPKLIMGGYVTIEKPCSCS